MYANQSLIHIFAIKQIICSIFYHNKNGKSKVTYISIKFDLESFFAGYLWTDGNCHKEETLWSFTNDGDKERCLLSGVIRKKIWFGASKMKCTLLI